MAEPEFRHKSGDRVLARFQSVDVVGTVEAVEVEPAQVFYSIRTRDGLFVTVHEDYVQEVKDEPGK
ncbi:MAG: hypothetical protein K6E40_04715 [Desulfovibrio sp.]|nr:hypothetical protein [Desulfovibrio sp.]